MQHSIGRLGRCGTQHWYTEYTCNIAFTDWADVQHSLVRLNKCATQRYMGRRAPIVSRHASEDGSRFSYKEDMATMLGLKNVQTYESPVVQHATVINSSSGYRNVTLEPRPFHNVESKLRNAWVLV